MELTFRFAKGEDSDTYYKWVNNPMVRAHSFKQELIRYDDHLKWFHARLASSNCFLYLFFNDESLPVGQVRIEKSKETIIDISVDENFRGRSYSSKILKMACTDYLAQSKGDTIFSYIKTNNPASYKSFIKSGFSETHGSKEADYYRLYVTDKTRHHTINSFKKNGRLYEVKLLDNLDLEETNQYFELFHKCFGKRPQLDFVWFDWFYNKNPYGVCNNYALIDTTENKYAGIYGLAKNKLIDGRKSYICGVGVNGMIDSDYRNQGLYADLMRVIINSKDENDVAVSYPHGLNKGSVAGHYKAGWKLLKKAEFYKATDLHQRAQDTNVREIFSFIDQPGIDQLLATNAYASYFERTPAWLQWRFFSRPYKKYNALAYFDAAGKIKGFVILGYYKGSMNRCQLLDYNAMDDGIRLSLINSAKQMAGEKQCDELDLWQDDFADDLAFFGQNHFNKTGEFYELLVFSKKGYNFDKNIKTTLADLDAV